MDTKPTDKKLTLVEWIAKNFKPNEIIERKNMEEAMRFWLAAIINDGLHKNCAKNKCNLCGFEAILSKYHEYFKQK